MFAQKEPVSHYIDIEGYEIHVTEWGVDNPQSILMWHGLARTGRDFDHLAEHLSDRYRILCPDTLGRGLSSWANNPDNEYCFEFYEKIAVKICEIFGFFNFDYIGTSMGASLGMRLASGPMKDNINHLLINDIAPELAAPAVERILSYTGHPPVVDNMTQLEDFLRTVYEPYGYLTDEHWRLMLETSYRRLENGKITLHYDPKLVQQFVSHPNDYDIWDKYEKIECPTLVLRGENSDLLLPEWAEKMSQTGPQAQVLTIPNCGHAPALNKTQHYQIVEDFLNS